MPSGPATMNEEKTHDIYRIIRLINTHESPTLDDVFSVTPVLLTVLGWSGAVSTLTAYALVTHRRLAPDSLAYQLMNIGGSSALAVSATANEAWPSAAVNVLWVLIGLQSLMVATRQLSVLRRARAENAGGDASTPRPARSTPISRLWAGRPRRVARGPYRPENRAVLAGPRRRLVREAHPVGERPLERAGATAGS